MMVSEAYSTDTSLFDSTADMKLIIKAILTGLNNPTIVVFSDWNAAQDESRKFRLYCDASRGGFGTTLDQKLTDGSTLPSPSLIALPFPIREADPSSESKLARWFGPSIAFVSTSSKSHSLSTEIT